MSTNLYRADEGESFAVIGGEGFVGQALVQGLQKAYPHHAVASFGLTQRTFSLGYRFYRTDITSLESIREALKASGANTVFHTASPHGNATQEVCEQVNVRGTEAVVQACKEAGVKKLVFTSTCTIVFEGTSLINVDERLPPTEKLDVPYVWTKARAERTVLEANGQDGLETCALRLSGIIGAGERQVIPGLMNVLHSRQTMFQIGDNLNLFDIVHVTNVVHAHILAAAQMSKPAPSPLAFGFELEPPSAISAPRRNLPNSNVAENADRFVAPGSGFPPSTDPPRPPHRTRFSQFYDLSTPTETASSISSVPGVAGQAFYITNMEPVPFWTFARAVWHAYDGHVVSPRWKITIPANLGMALATCAEWFGWIRGVKKEDCGLPRAHMQYVLSDMYFDTEKARRVLGYEPLVSLEAGIKDAVEWYKEDEARQKAQDSGRKKEK